jgi:hypothetical protein
MQCALAYMNHRSIIARGGVGVCELSDGRVIDLSW